MGRGRVPLLLLVLFLAGGARGARAASFPPGLRFRSVSTGRVTVHYHQGLELMARRAATLATEILERHEARYGTRVGRVQIVLADVDDDPNGFASPLPYPLVHLRAVAPDGSDDFGNYDDWLRLVLTHELTHIVHLDEARGLVRVGRDVMGRAPYLFPNASTPTWMVEGLAVYEETQGTAFGRGRNPDVRMVMRMAALEEDFIGEDQAVSGLDRWPAGEAAYFFGEAFLADLAQRLGPDVLPELARVHSGRVIPFLDELTARKVTGAGFHQRWNDWWLAARESFASEARAIRARGLTDSRALTTRGFRQVAPRFSPDGEWIAFTDRDLIHFRAIHLIHPDGSGEKELVKRNGGEALAWTPDARRIVYDEPDVYRTFSVRSDLRVVDVATGRTRRLTRGVRARDPDVSRDGRTVAFVRQQKDGSDLALVGMDGAGQRDLTRSAPGTQWGAPRWSPSGDALVASRWLPGGWLDIVRVEAATGAVTELTHDRAKDVEPSWTPDGAYVVFRSDRDGVSNLYAVRVADRALLRVTNVMGGAFAPDVAPDGRQLAFASYSARGYDVHVMPLDPAGFAPAAAFVDRYPPAPPSAPLALAADRPYRPGALILPRFWTPYADFSSGDTRLGAVTGGADALLRHAWAAEAHYGTGTGRLSGQLYYLYDRFRPALSVSAEDKTELVEGGRARTREVTLRATVPVLRTLRASSNVSVAWRRRHETTDGLRPGLLDLGGLETSWSLGTAKVYAYSISPVDGYRLRAAFLRESPGLGSDLALGKLFADARLYARGVRGGDVVAGHVATGTTVGDPAFQRSFALGGFADGALFDVVGTNHSVLRGYPDSAFTGRRFVNANLEYRLPLAHPQRGFRVAPIFVRHVHATVFGDVGEAWSDGFRWSGLRPAVGAALGADLTVSHALPITIVAGAARGLADKGETRAYVRAGLAF